VTQETRLRPGFLRLGNRKSSVPVGTAAGAAAAAARLRRRPLRLCAAAPLQRAPCMAPQRAMLRAAHVMPITACRAAAAS